MENTKKNRAWNLFSVFVIVFLVVPLLIVLFIGVVSGINKNMISSEENKFLSQESIWVDENGSFTMEVSKEHECMLIKTQNNSSEVIQCFFDTGSGFVTAYKFDEHDPSFQRDDTRTEYDYIITWDWDHKDTFTLIVTNNYSNNKDTHPELILEDEQIQKIIFKKQNTVEV